MIDVKLLLQDFDYVAQNLANRNVEKAMLDVLKENANKLKQQKNIAESMQAEQNKLSKEYGELMRKKADSNLLQSHKENLDTLKRKVQEEVAKVAQAEVALQEILLKIPNLLDKNTPIGTDENDNVVIKHVLEPKKFSFTPKEHWELAEKNKWIDFEAGVKLAKSRFSVLRGEAARLNHALISYMLDFNYKNGFEVCSVPVIVNERAMFGTGQLPKFADDMFHIESMNDDINESEDSNKGHNLYLISTSEISLTNLYQDMILAENELPIMMTAYTPCFRKEAGSAGRDTRGIIRQHQFDKVELVAITTPEQSESMQQRMVDNVSKLLESLELPHRLVQLCSGDIGFSATNTIDLEVWLPGQNCYREISSVSNCADFQARRAKIRYKRAGKNTLTHTLNGSSLAVGRTLVAIMENFQQADGSIQIPKVLEKYL